VILFKIRKKPEMLCIISLTMIDLHDGQDMSCSLLGMHWGRSDRFL